MDTVGERLKSWRKSNNYKLSELSENAGISQGALSDAENNKKLISSQTLLSLKRIYEIDITWILTGEQTKNLELTENEKELLKNFKFLPEREQIKFIGRLEDIAEKYKNNEGKSSSSKIG